MGAYPCGKGHITGMYKDYRLLLYLLQDVEAMNVLLALIGEMKTSDLR